MKRSEREAILSILLAEHAIGEVQIAIAQPGNDVRIIHLLDGRIEREEPHLSIM